MTPQSGTLRTADGVILQTIRWLPDAPPRAVVLLSHGIGEHSGRYAHVAEAFTAQGLALYALDHRTHGRSGGQPRVYFQRFDSVLDDLKLYLDEVQAAQPGVPVFLYGHSLGALIALAFTLRHQDALRGLIVTGAPLEVEHAQPKALIVAAQVLNVVMPRLGVAKPIDSSLLSTDERVGKAYDADALVYHGEVSVRMGYHIVMESRKVKARAGELRLPILILHGEADVICPPAGSRLLNERVSSADKTYHTFPGLRHEIHNEAGREAILADMAEWVLERA